MDNMYSFPHLKEATLNQLSPLNCHLRKGLVEKIKCYDIRNTYGLFRNDLQ